MSFNVSANGLGVIEARLLVSRTGAWMADVAVDALTATKFPDGGRVTLKLAGGAISYVGTKYRGDVYAQSVTLKLVGGNNGLAKDCTPRFYMGPALQVPLADLMKDSGETLSGTSSATALTATVPFWVMLKQRVSAGLSSLADAGPDGTVWRVLPDGTVFFGVDGFAPSALSDFELLDYYPQEKYQLIAAETPNVYPGESFNGFNVSDVEHVINASGSRARIWFE